MRFFLASSPTLPSGSSFVVHSEATPNFCLYFPPLPTSPSPQPPEAFAHMHSFAPQSAMMPEVRALPTPRRANTTGCHSNKNEEPDATSPSYAIQSSPSMIWTDFFLSICPRCPPPFFFALSRQKKRKAAEWCLSLAIAIVSTRAGVSRSCSHMD